MSNKIRYGLKNVHIAPVTLVTDSTTGEQTVSFGTPKAWPGAVSMSTEPQGETAKFYADDGLYWVGTANDGYEATFESALVPDWFYTDYLGQTIDDNGNIVETDADTEKYFAMTFEFTGDVKQIKHVLYYCKAARPSEESETKGESIEPKTSEMTITATACPQAVEIDGEKRHVIKGRSTEGSANYATWHNTIALPTFEEAV